ncbi:MAG: FG-GAP-like repeat-containing protein, partial [Actinomycetota bacterium]
GGGEAVSSSSREEIAAGADAGGGPHVKLFNGSGGSVLSSFFAYNSAFTGGVRVAIGDGDSDGNGEIVTAPGAGGGSHIRLFE